MKNKAVAHPKRKNLLHVVESVLNLAILPLCLQSIVHSLFLHATPEQVVQIATEANPDITVSAESMIDLEVAAAATGAE